jgi:adenylosuccinate synthase
MKTARVVIGASWGDEGKGHIVARYVRSMKEPLVIRFNGGAQAGHTIVRGAHRHVASHVGAGVLDGVPTLLSRYFIVNPILYLRELDRLAACGIGGTGLGPVVYVSAVAPVTTPFDMILNMSLEDARKEKHGSCGVGINETVERSQHSDFRVTVADLCDEKRCRTTLERIRSEWLPRRLTDLGMADALRGYTDMTMSNDLIPRWLDDCADMLSRLQIVNEVELLRSYDELVFEGAQGLALDEIRGAFPHVTRSRTGVHNAAMLAFAANLPSIDVTYVTRPYATRHGHGPLPHEGSVPFAAIDDQTNLPNVYQGSLRFGLLNLTEVSERIHTDLGDALGFVQNIDLAVTCLDQVTDTLSWVEGADDLAVTETGDIDRFLDRAQGITRCDRLIARYGETAEAHEHLYEAYVRR